MVSGIVEGGMSEGEYMDDVNGIMQEYEADELAMG